MPGWVVHCSAVGLGSPSYSGTVTSGAKTSHTSNSRVFLSAESVKPPFNGCPFFWLQLAYNFMLSLKIAFSAALQVIWAR